MSCWHTLNTSGNSSGESFLLFLCKANQNQALTIQTTKKEKASLQTFSAERERILLFTRGGRVIQVRSFSVADKSQVRNVKYKEIVSLPRV